MSGNVLTPGVYLSVIAYLDWIDGQVFCQDSDALVASCAECHTWSSCDIEYCTTSVNGADCTLRPECSHCDGVYSCFGDLDLSQAECTRINELTEDPWETTELVETEDIESTTEAYLDLTTWCKHCCQYRGSVNEVRSSPRLRFLNRQPPSLRRRRNKFIYLTRVNYISVIV